MRDLSPLEKDSLKELFNIGMGRAAASLGELTDEIIRLSVPRLYLLSRLQAATLLGKALNDYVWAICQRLTGEFNAEAMLLFPDDSSLEIARLLAGDTIEPEELAHLEQDAVREAGNIILSACLGTILNILDADLHFETLTVQRGECGEILQVPGNDHRSILLVHVSFALERRAIHGYVAFVQDSEATERLIHKIEGLWPSRGIR
jgi:chemotaxis protein CheC